MVNESIMVDEASLSQVSAIGKGEGGARSGTKSHACLLDRWSTILFLLRFETLMAILLCVSLLR